jgi:hypothetical protein
MCNHLVDVTTHGDEVEGGFHKTYGQAIFPYFHNIHLFVVWLTKTHNNTSHMKKWT